MVGELAIREHWNEAAATQGNVEFDAERIWVTGGTVLASWHGAITRRATAERIRERGFMTIELDDAGLGQPLATMDGRPQRRHRCQPSGRAGNGPGRTRWQVTRHSTW